MKNKNSNLRTGVVGSGSMGKNHARVYSEISNFVAIADTDEKQAKAVSELYGVKKYSDYREMLKEVDAISIAVPTALHRDVAISAIKAGVHVLIEKPLANSLDDAKSIAEESKKQGVVLAVGHIERHNPVISYAKKALIENKWGDLVTMSSKRISLYPKRIVDVGVIFDLAVHDLDVMRYLADSEAQSIFSVCGALKRNNLEDHASVLIEFDNGITGVSEVSWITPMKVRQITLSCTEAFVMIDYTNQEIDVYKSIFGDINFHNLSNIEMEIKKESIKIDREEPLKIEIIDFLSAITKSRSPLVTVLDGVAVVDMAERVVNQFTNNKLKNL